MSKLRFKDEWGETWETEIPKHIPPEGVTTQAKNLTLKDDMPNYSKHLTPDSFRVIPDKNGVLIGAGFAAFMFLLGMLFERYVLIGVFHI
jgi:hypothetical protein